MTTIINADNGVISGVSGLKYSADNSGILVIQTNSTTALTINADQTATFAGAVNFASASFVAPVIVQGSTTDSALRITQTGAGNALLVEDAANPDSSPFVIDNAGNVGIGTSTPVSSSGYGALTLNGTTGSLLYLQTNATSAIQIATNSAGASITAIGASLPLYFSTNSTERMRIDSSGNVFIGAISANGGQQFYVSGGSGMAYQRSTDNNFAPVLDYLKSRGSAASPTIVQDGDGLFSLRVAPYNGSSYTYLNSIGVAIDGSVVSGQNPPTRITFNTNTTNGATTERMRIDSSGNVGIGITSPGYKLHVVGGQARIDVSSASTSLVCIGTGSNFQVDHSTAGYATLTNSANSNAAFIFKGASNESMRITSAGNVGIGISSPQTTLHTYGASQAAAIIQTGAQSFIMFGKTINSYNNAAATNLFTFSTGGNTGVMVKVVIRGTSAVTNQMYEDVGYAWWRWLSGSYQGSGVTTVTTVINVQGTHTVGTLSWANPSTAPALQYTQGANGYILESIDVYITCRDALSGLAFAPASISFG